MGTNVYLDGEPQVVETAGCFEQGVQSVEHHLKLQLVEAIDKGDEVELAYLSMALKDVSERGPARLLEMVEEDDRTAR